MIALVAALVAAVPVVHVATLSGSVNPGSGDYLLGAIRAAEDQGAEALIVRLDTPGGLLSTTRDVVQAELSARVPVVVWVGPPGARAGSAGVFVTLAAHVAAMAPSTNIGAAHPVGAGATPGKKDAPEGDSATMLRKIENDTAAFVRGIAERRARNVEWAEKAVRDSESITADRAVRLRVVDLLAEDLPELLKKLDGRKVTVAGGELRALHTAGAELRTVGWPVKDRFLHWLADPEILYLIAMLGVLGILAELYHPGTLVPGIVGAICLIIAGVGFQLLPIHAGAALLVAFGVALCAAELYFGGHGGFIAAGAVAIAVGSLLLVGHVDSKFFADSDFGLGLRIVLPVTLALALIAGTLVWKVSQSARRPVRTGGPGLIGEVAEVREPVGPSGGNVVVHGELWSAVSETVLPAGARGVVIAVDGLRVRIVPAKPSPGGVS